VAGHIIPWKENIERTNPQNGLCLNNIHDRAFEKGFFTLSENYEVVLSKRSGEFNPLSVEYYFYKYNNQRINLPDRFLPNQEFLRVHRENVFQI